jgi:hypothetical protein
VESGFHISWEEALKSEILGTWVTLSLCASFPPIINERSLALFETTVEVIPCSSRAPSLQAHLCFPKWAFERHGPWEFSNNSIHLSVSLLPFLTPSRPLSLLPQWTFWNTKISLCWKHPNWLPITFRVKSSAGKFIRKYRKNSYWELTLILSDP